MLSFRALLSRPRKRVKRKHSIKPKCSSKQRSLRGYDPPFADEGEADDCLELPGFRLKSSDPSRSHGVQPLGNLYISPSRFNSRDAGLGGLSVLSDDLVIDILGLLDGAELGRLSLVSKSFYVFCRHEPLWRNLSLESLKGEFLFTGSWKSTYVSGCYPHFRAEDGCVEVRDFYSDYLFQSWLCANVVMRPEWLKRDNIVRRRGISLEEFISCFEDLNKPVLLEGCIDGWAALGRWDKEYLVHIAGDKKFAVGPVDMSLEGYYKYAESTREERPLYLFDPKFAEKVPVLGSEYDVPIYFREDLFSVLGDERPDYRWIIIGPAGSGSSFHIDPNSTSAWNAVVKGSKKWVMFPPDVVPPGVHPSADGAEVACPVSIIEWFMNFYEVARSWEKKPVECICKAGEVIFVPNGWWHMVFNLEESIAITQNYVSRSNLLNVLDFLKQPNAQELVSGTNDRINLYDKFKNAMEAKFPGTIDELRRKAEEKAILQRKQSFWDSATDSKVGAFKFSF
ncbi:hypothetical protein MLD38_035599 [Melastoma candidum]|uniref:Uncharacterized protein n=1 Tax=Melastoma candidum TaxID=119954 RepID=A0ACB9LH25_9MYRT|nr:hypothetical protein MLD38_035599 [Melastoma candidum]